MPGTKCCLEIYEILLYRSYNSLFVYLVLQVCMDANLYLKIKVCVMFKTEKLILW